MSDNTHLHDAYLATRPRSAACFHRACQTLGGKAGHDLRYFEPVPLYIERGAEGRKWDVDGNEYIDFLMGNGSLLLGHAAPAVVDAIVQTAGKGTHFGSDHPLHLEWAELVQQMVPAAERVRFVNSGTEATLLAFRLARAFTGRSRTLRFDGHFHGWHDDVVHGFQPPFDADGSLGIPPGVRDYMVQIPVGDADLVAATLDSDGDIAAVIVEPSGGSWGRAPLDPVFLRDLRDVTARREVLLIFDEVITGFRFSPGGAQELYGVSPDLSSYAKILCGGMPGGAVAGRADVLATLDVTGDPHHDRYDRVAHQGTFNAAPLSAAAGVATLRQVATGAPIERADGLADTLRQAWDEVLGRLGVDVMSSTGGVLSSAHTERDVTEATAAFEETVRALREGELVYCM